MPNTRVGNQRIHNVLLVVLGLAWASQIYYLWPTPFFVAEETIGRYGATFVWMHFLKWLALIIGGLFATYLLYRKHPLWSLGVLLSSALYLWFVQFPGLWLPFFEDARALPRRMQSLSHLLGSLVVVHLQLVLPLVYSVAMVYALAHIVTSYVRGARSRSRNGVQL
jgi:hypothetical protein